MGKRGPKPTPTVLRLLRGNPGKRPVNRGEPQFNRPAPGSIACPARLKGEAAAEWARLVHELVGAGVVTVADLGSFEAYCFIHGLVRRYEDAVAKMTPAKAISSGLQSQLIKLEGLRRALAGDLGITPASRTAVRAVPAKSATEKAEDRYFGPRRT